MRLDLGGIETIANPTPEQVAHHLQFIPAESPYIILERGEGEFVQACVEAGQYRVEYKENDLQWFVFVEYEKALSIFEIFLTNAGDISDMARWKKLNLADQISTKGLAVGIFVILLGLMTLGLWNEIEQWLEIYR